MYKLVKRFFDFTLSLLALIVLSPVLLITAVAVKIDSKGPVFYRQARLGKDGKVFTMLKFRSMRLGSEKSGVYSNAKDPRITKVGNIIRKTSIDELPQLINIIRGDMSIIGPRPPLVYHPWPYEEYTDEQKKMFGLRPGLTGWAQVNGRKDVEWNKRIEYSVYYVEHLSFMLDLKIFFMTIYKVLANEDNENIENTVIEKKAKEGNN